MFRERLTTMSGAPHRDDVRPDRQYWAVAVYKAARESHNVVNAWSTSRAKNGSPGITVGDDTRTPVRPGRLAPVVRCRHNARSPRLPPQTASGRTAAASRATKASETLSKAAAAFKRPDRVRDPIRRADRAMRARGRTNVRCAPCGGPRLTRTISGPRRARVSEHLSRERSAPDAAFPILS